MSTFTIIITAAAVACFGAFVLFCAFIDGRRQKLLEHGQHPVTTPTGQVHAAEEAETDGL